jgi:hypothetical protein
MNNEMIGDDWQEHQMQEADDDYRIMRARKRHFFLIHHYIPILATAVVWLLGCPSDVCIAVGAWTLAVIFISAFGHFLDTLGGRGDDTEAAYLAVARHDKQRPMSAFAVIGTLMLWAYPVGLTFCVLYEAGHREGAWIATVLWFFITMFEGCVISEPPLETSPWQWKVDDNLDKRFKRGKYSTEVNPWHRGHEETI